MHDRELSYHGDPGAGGGVSGMSRDELRSFVARAGVNTDAYDVARDIAGLLEGHDVIKSAVVTSYDEGYEAAHIAVEAVDCSFVIEVRGVEAL